MEAAQVSAPTDVAVPTPLEVVDEAKVALERIAALRSDVTRPLLAAEIGDERLLLGGPMAEGRFGDFALRNEFVHAIVSNRDHVAANSPHGGILIDIATVARPFDYLGWTTPTSNSIGNPDLKIGSVRVTRDGADGELAEITVKGTATSITGATPLEATIRYRLRPGDRSLTVSVSWTNAGTAPTNALYPTECINWGAAPPFAPKRGYLSLAGSTWEEFENVWVSGINDPDDYSLTFYNEKRAFYGRHLIVNSRLRWAMLPDEIANVAPGASVESSHRIRPGTRDLADPLAEVYTGQGIPTGQLAGRVLDRETGLPVSGAEVRLQSVDRKPGAGPRPFATTRADAQGEFLFVLPADEYITTAYGIGRQTFGPQLSAFVEAGSSSEKIHLLNPPILLDVKVTDKATGEPLPARVTLTEPNGGVYARLGLPFEVPFAGNTYYSLTGSGRFAVPKSPYGVLVTAGPAYPAYEQSIAFTAAGIKKPFEVRAELERQVAPTGWISMAVGSKTNASHGCLVTPQARVISALVEGIDLLVVTDENVLTDLRPVVRDLAMQNRIAVAGGIQFRDHTRTMPGVFSVYPVDLDTPPETVAAVVREVTSSTDPATIFATLRRAFPNTLIQVDEPTDKTTGYLARMGLDTREDFPTYTQWKEGFSADFDLVQVMHGREEERDDFKDRFEAWMQVLLTGNTHVRFSAGDNSKGLRGEETGYPRMMVHSPASKPGAPDLDEVTQSLRAGKIVATMGPFVGVDLDGAMPGTMVKPDENNFLSQRELKVLGTNWAATKTLTLQREGKMQNLYYVIGGSFPQQFPSVEDSQVLRRHKFIRDSCVTVLVQGAGSMVPALARTRVLESQLPVARALTGPIFVDADGDGKYTPPIPSRRFRE